MQKHLTTFALVFAIINFSSCGSLPVKPSIDSGIIIAEENIVFYVNNQTSAEHERQVVNACEINTELNKSIVHSNEDWNKVLTYIRLLEKAVPNRIKKELIKARKSFSILNKRAH